MKFYPFPVLVPKKGKEFYNIFKFENPGLLKCYGLCNKNILKRYEKTKKLNLGYSFKGDLTQLGGSFIINNEGQILFSRYDRYLGDQVPSDIIFEKFDVLLGRYFIDKNEENYLNEFSQPIKKGTKDSDEQVRKEDEFEFNFQSSRPFIPNEDLSVTIKAELEEEIVTNSSPIKQISADLSNS